MKKPTLENIDKDGRILPVLHGELTLIPVADQIEGELKKSKKFILAHSETGHDHVLEAPTAFDYVEMGNDRAVVISKVATLFHDKTYDVHESITIQPATYRVDEAIEYNPFLKEMQRVFD